MKRNYKVTQGISLEIDGLNLDLYNNYSLDEFAVSAMVREVILRFRLECPIVDTPRPECFSVLFRGVTFFETSYPTLGDEAGVVDEVGFKERHDRDLAWLKQDGQELPEDDIILRISGGRYIRLAAEASEVRLAEASATMQPAHC